MDTAAKLWSKVDLPNLMLNFCNSPTAAMALYDLKGVILWGNDRLADIFEEPKDAIIGSYVGHRVIYPKGQSPDSRIKQAVEKGYAELLKTKWVTKSGKAKFMHQRIYRLDDKSGNHIGFWGIAYELTTEKQSIDDSRAAIRVLTDMREEEIRERQLEVIDMLKAQGNVLCPAKALRGKYCPAILAVEESLVKDRQSLKALLTDTEFRVAEYVKQGMSTKVISGKMSISERTVKNHRFIIRKKINISHTNIHLAKHLQSFPA